MKNTKNIEELKGKMQRQDKSIALNQLAHGRFYYLVIYLGELMKEKGKPDNIEMILEQMEEDFTRVWELIDETK